MTVMVTVHGATATAASPHIVAVAAAPGHAFSKAVQPMVRLLAGRGVESDGHAGTTVQHRSRVARDPTQPNLRQVHLMHAELFDALALQGHGAIEPGQLGENLTTRGLDLLALPADTRLHVGDAAVLRLTGLRNPCAQIERFRPGLLAAVLPRDADGTLRRLAGVMAVVEQGGVVRPGDAIRVEPAPTPHRALAPV